MTTTVERTAPAPRAEPHTTTDRAACVNAEVFSLTGVTWEAYCALRDSLDRNGSSGVYLTYDDGSLDLMSPLYRHDEPKMLIDRAVIVLCEAYKKRYRSVGSATQRSQTKNQGFEPDHAYFLLPEKLAALPRGRFPEDYDVAAGPAPDLGIEIDVTHSSIPRLPLYAAFGVGEVWRTDAAGDKVEILRLVKGDYFAGESELFPGLTGALLSEALTLETADDPAWMAAFRELLRERLGRSAK